VEDITFPKRNLNLYPKQSVVYVLQYEAPWFICNCYNCISREVGTADCIMLLLAERFGMSM